MKELLESINNTIAISSLDIRVLNDKESLMIFEKLKKRFEFDYSELFIWENNRHIFSIKAYEENWEDCLKESLFSFGNSIYLIVSAEDYYPWKIYHGDKNQIINVLAEQIYFEYMIIDENLESVLVDTHENELVKLNYQCEN